MNNNDEDEDKKSNKKEKKVTDWLDFIAQHKFFTVVVLILVIMGFGKIAKHLHKYKDRFD
jgi:predicted RND superfamily exporter protein